MNYIGLIATIVSLAAAFAAAATGYYKSAKSDTLLKLVTEERNFFEKKSIRLESDNAALLTENANLQKLNTELMEKVQGSPQLIALTSEIRNLATEMRNMRRELKR